MFGGDKMEVIGRHSLLNFGFSISKNYDLDYKHLRTSSKSTHHGERFTEHGLLGLVRIPKVLRGEDLKVDIVAISFVEDV